MRLCEGFERICVRKIQRLVSVSLSSGLKSIKLPDGLCLVFPIYFKHCYLEMMS